MFRSVAEVVEVVVLSSIGNEPASIAGISAGVGLLTLRASMSLWQPKRSICGATSMLSRCFQGFWRFAHPATLVLRLDHKPIKSNVDVCSILGCSSCFQVSTTVLVVLSYHRICHVRRSVVTVASNGNANVVAAYGQSLLGRYERIAHRAFLPYFTTPGLISGSCLSGD